MNAVGSCSLGTTSKMGYEIFYQILDTIKALTEYIYDNFKPEEDEGEDDSTEAQRERCCHRGPEEPPCERENCECEGHS